MAAPVNGYTDATSYLQSNGISFMAMTAGGVPVIFKPGAATATSAPNAFSMDVPGLGPGAVSYQLNFCTALDSISFSRVTVAAQSGIPAWTATALNAQGQVVATFGEGFQIGPAARTVTLSGIGITALRIEGRNDLSRTTFNVPPIDDLTLVAAVPAVCALAGKNTSLNFDSVTAPASGYLDATSYLQSHGISLMSAMAGGVPVIFKPGAATATSAPNAFSMDVPGLGPGAVSYQLNFCTALDSISFSRVTVAAQSGIPAWTATALNAQGQVVAAFGEGFQIGPAARTVTLSGIGITALRIEGRNDLSRTAFNVPPIDDLTLNTDVTTSVAGNGSAGETGVGSNPASGTDTGPAPGSTTPTAATVILEGNLSINGVTNGTYDVGGQWSLSMNSGPADMPFSLCALKDAGTPVCASNFGRTDQNGSWSASGSFDSSVIGAWSEWITFASRAISNRIAFTVAHPVTGAFRINGSAGGNFAPTQQWQISLTGAPANTSFDLCSSTNYAQSVCAPHFASTDANGSWALSGVFNVDVAGGWTEWVRFPSGATTNPITFTVGTAVQYRTYGLDFSPYLNGEDPNTGQPIPEGELKERIARVAPYTDWIRAYGSTNGLERVGAIAHAYGIKVAVGIWLDSNNETNDSEIANGIALARSGAADMLVIGSEVLLRNDLSEPELIAYIQKVKQAVPNVTVTTADTYAILEGHPNVVAACDVIFANFFGYWEGNRLETS